MQQSKITLLKDKITDYFDNFDYIFGDFAYDKVRLKGFNDKKNKNFKPINDYRKVDEYIKNCCAYECRYFIIKKIIIFYYILLINENNLTQK